MTITPLDKSNLSNILDSITKAHDEYKRRQKEVKNALLGLQSFYTQVNPEDISKKELHKEILYQYRLENQSIFGRYKFELELISASIFPVVINLQKEMYSIERRMTQPNDNSRPETITGPNGQQVHVYQKPNILEKLSGLGRRTPESVNDLDSPYVRNISLVEKVKNTSVFVTKWIDYHTKGLSRSKRATKQAMQLYLMLEIKYFNSHVEPQLISVMGEAYRLAFVEEKQHAASVLTQSIRQSESHRDKPDFTEQ